jgi:hypothetical protein
MVLTVIVDRVFTGQYRCNAGFFKRIFLFKGTRLWRDFRRVYNYDWIALSSAKNP